jgi:hypothetical protein
MRKPGSGGHNTRPVKWNGKDYNSLKELTDEFGLIRGYLSYYIRENRPFKGFKVYYI